MIPDGESKTIYYRENFKYQLTRDAHFFVEIPVEKPIETAFIKVTPCLNGCFIEVSKGYAWDGASGPTYDNKTNMAASLIHDAIYQLMRLGLIDEKYRYIGDNKLKERMINDGAFKVRAWYYEKAVSNFAASYAHYGNESKELQAP